MSATTTDEGPGDIGGIEGGLDDEQEKLRNLADVHHDDRQTRHEVEHTHEGDDLAGDTPDSLDSADDDESNEMNCLQELEEARQLSIVDLEDSEVAPPEPFQYYVPAVFLRSQGLLISSYCQYLGIERVQGRLTPERHMMGQSACVRRWLYVRAAVFA